MNENKLVKAIVKKDNKQGRTDNGAKTYKSSLNACVDMFGTIAAMRQRDDATVIKTFTNAFAEDPLKAMKILFYVRDVRGGQGERKVVHTIFKYMATAHTEAMKKNIKLIPEFGRWDDLYVFVGTPLERKALNLIKKQILADMDSDTPSICAKWVKSVNTSSTQSRRLGTLTAKVLGWSAKEYRKNISALRKKINIVEQAMCSGEWNGIDYSKVTSRASMIYRDAFGKHDPKGYAKFLKDVESGKTEIKASTLYPYDLMRNVFGGCSGWGRSDAGMSAQPYNKTIDLQWQALPNYVENSFNGIVIADTSGSMTCAGADGVSPMLVSLSLAAYIAERNEGIWKDTFMTFSSEPTLQTLKGSNIFEKMNSFKSIVSNTNLQASFDLILSTAKANKLKQKDLPEVVIVVSDMQFDSATSAGWGRSQSVTNFKAIKQQYKDAGYKKPRLVFWNVNAKGGNSPVKFDTNGTCLVSGCSPSILKTILSGEITSPQDMMNQAIEVERYEKIKV